MLYKSMEHFENTVNFIRDKLRTEGITGMDSINHCLAFVILRYLTINKCKELNIPEEYAFENFMLDKNTKKKLNDDDQRLLGKFYHKTDKGLQECLIKRLKTNGKIDFTQLNFKVKSPIYFSQILNALSKIDLDNLALDFDIVGLVYELHLKTKSTGSGMRDLGQFFTNRQVIKYMVKLCDPKMNKNGEIEKILDPSMGTGGFLTMSIKHLNDKYQNKIDWDKNKNRIYGFDIDENVRNFALLNTLLECEKDFSKTLVHNDTLRNDYLIDKDNKTIIDKVDIILANEPFGLKNIIHADCCKRINDLKIRGTKAEPLFLQLMMLSLNQGGRCAVIVPDGVLFNDAKLHKDTRKHLCKNLNLQKVISLEDGLFLNTGVKSSILFFVNDEETKEVEFCKIKLLNSEIVEESIIKVNIKDIEKNDYSLFVNKYNSVEEEKLDGLEYKKLMDICNFLPTTKHYTSIGQSIGKYRYYNSSQDDRLYLETCEINKESIIIGNGGSICVHYDSNFTASKHVTVAQVIKEDCLTKYIYYYLLLNRYLLTDQSAGSTIAWLNKTNMGNIKIPIPSLSLQQQIVEALDSIYDTIEENNKLIQNYEKIKKGIIWSNTLNVEKKKLGDITVFEQKNKKLKASDSLDNGKYKFYTSSNKIGYRNDFEFKDYKLIIGRGGNSCVFFDKEFGISHDDIFVIGFKNNDLQYIYNYLSSNFSVLQNILTGSTIKHINKENLSALNIPIPSKQTQEHIVKECEYYDNLIDTLKKENERLQNNKIIDMVLKSVSNDNQLEEELIDESETEEEDKPQTKKQLAKEIKKVVEEKPKKTGTKSKSNVI